MYYITGDIHGNPERFDTFMRKFSPTSDDTLIILGDSGFNYYLNKKDLHFKEYVSGNYPFTVLNIHGNHEARPSGIESYRERDFCDGKVYAEDAFPKLLFAKDGEIYMINRKPCLVIGGAYSVDKQYRLDHGWKWFPDEQPDDATKKRVEKKIADFGAPLHAILSHTCPLKYEPVEVFLAGIDQSKVDKSTEQWLDKIEDETEYEKWYCGHYHTDKKIDKMRFMFQDIELFE